MLHVHKMLEAVVYGLGVMLNLFWSKVAGGPQGVCIQDGTGAEFEGLKALVGIRNVLSHQHYAVILHDDCFVVGILLEFAGYLFSQQFASRKGVGGESNRPANSKGLGDDGGVGDLVGDAEGYKSRRMGVDYTVKLGMNLVQGFVEWIFRRRFVRPYNGAVGLNAHYVGRGKRPLVDACGGDPDVAVIVEDRKISTGSGGHSAAVDHSYDQGDLLGGMHQFNV